MYLLEKLIEEVKLLTNKTDENLISLILNKSIKEVEIYTNEKYNEKFNNVVVDIAVIKLNKLGTEGLVSQSYSGVSEVYIDDYPTYILNQLNKLKKGWGML